MYALMRLQRSIRRTNQENRVFAFIVSPNLSVKPILYDVFCPCSGWPGSRRRVLRGSLVSTLTDATDIEESALAKLSRHNLGSGILQHWQLGSDPFQQAAAARSCQ